jgi:hypothetical protein
MAAFMCPLPDRCATRSSLIYLFNIAFAAPTEYAFSPIASRW